MYKEIYQLIGRKYGRLSDGGYDKIITRLTEDSNDVISLLEKTELDFDAIDISFNSACENIVENTNSILDSVSALQKIANDKVYIPNNSNLEYENNLLRERINKLESIIHIETTNINNSLHELNKNSTNIGLSYDAMIIYSDLEEIALKDNLENFKTITEDNTSKILNRLNELDNNLTETIRRN